MRDLLSAIRELAREYPRFFWPVAALLLVPVALFFYSRRPLSPKRTIEAYVDRLQKQDCAGAFEFVADERKNKDLDMQYLEDFDRTVCQEVRASFAKLFIQEDGYKDELNGPDDRAVFYLCALPKGFVRRECALHEATLKKEGYRWKIVQLNIGPWDSPHLPAMEKRENLIPSHSWDKRDE